MITLHRIYTWIMFPVIATLYLAMQIIQLAFSILNNLTYGCFFGEIPPPPEMPSIVPPGYEAQTEYLYRLLVAVLSPFETFWSSIKSLNTYKF